MDPARWKDDNVQNKTNSRNLQRQTILMGRVCLYMRQKAIHDSDTTFEKNRIRIRPSRKIRIRHPKKSGSDSRKIRIRILPNFYLAKLTKFKPWCTDRKCIRPRFENRIRPRFETGFGSDHILKTPGYK